MHLLPASLWLEQARPFGLHLANVGVAYVAVEDDIMRIQCAARTVQRFQRLVGRMDAVGFAVMA